MLGPPQRGVSKPRAYHFLKFAYMKVCLIVWDSGLKVMYEHSWRIRGIISRRFTNPHVWFYRIRLVSPLGVSLEGPSRVSRVLGPPRLEEVEPLKQDVDEKHARSW